jgi:methionine-rich copper-binding protein CopC
LNRRSSAAAVVVGIAMLAALLIAPRDVAAHARYESSEPAKGEVVQTSPSRVEITFTQEIQRVSGLYGITVEKDRGLDVTAGPAEVHDDDRSTMSIPLQPTLEPGRYVVFWHNVSDEDGDAAEGAFSFYVQDAPTAVDLENDRQLEEIGAEDETPTGEPTEEATTEPTAAATDEPTAAATSTPAAVETPADGDDGEDDGDAVAAIIAIVVVAAVALAAAGVGYTVVQRRRR